MTYLDFREFKELTGKDDEFQMKFDQYQLKACAVIDNITNHFYKRNDLVTDPIGFRVKQFKLALCAQIIYFSDMDADTYENLNSRPQTFTIGATTISNTSRYNAGGSNESKALLAEDVFIYLEGTGLFYRGVATC